MRKAFLALLVLAVVAVAGWTGLWFYGKGRIVDEIEQQARIIRDRGGEATYDAIDVGGFPLGYTGRIVSPRVSMAQEMTMPETGETVSARYTWSAPWIEASASVTAPDTLEMVFADAQEIVLDLPDTSAPLPIALTSENLTVTTRRSGDEIVFEGGTPVMGSSFTWESEEDGAVDATYAARDFTLSGRALQEQSGDRTPQLAMTYAIAGMDGTATFAGTPETPGGTVGFRTGPVEGTGDSLGQETTGALTVADLVTTLTFPQLGNEPHDIGIGRLAMKTRIPNEASPEPQPFAYRVDIADVTLAELFWTLADPTSSFEREFSSLVVDLDGTAIFETAPSNAEAFAKAMETRVPLRLQTMTVNDLTLDALGAKASASGTGALEDGVPQATGALAVEGFAGLMDGLVKSGRIPPQQAMVVQLMVESFARTEEDGAIRFDFEARDGMMYVNDIPVGEAPVIPQ